MFDGLKTMDKLVSDDKDEFVQGWKEKWSLDILLREWNNECPRGVQRRKEKRPLAGLHARWDIGC